MLESIPSFGNSLEKVYQYLVIGGRHGAGCDIRKSDLETFLYRLEDLLILIRAHKRDGETLGTETAGTADAMEVRVRINGQIVVDG